MQPSASRAATQRRRRLERFFGADGYPRDLAATTAAFDTRGEAGLVLNLAERSGWPVLDLGCGFGRHLAELSAHGPGAVGADVVFDCCVRASLHAPSVCCDNEQLGFRQGAFGLVYSFFTSVGYWRNDLDRLLTEAARVLRSGGLLLLELANRPSRPELRVWRESPPDQHRWIGVQLALPRRDWTSRRVWLLRGCPRPRCCWLSYALFSPAFLVQAAGRVGLAYRPDLCSAGQSRQRRVYVFERTSA